MHICVGTALPKSSLSYKLVWGVKREIVGQGLDDPRGLGSLLFITGQTGLQTYYRWSPIRTYTES
jgi:hypothetical protein